MGLYFCPRMVYHGRQRILLQNTLPGGMTMDTGKVTDPRDSNQLTRAYLNSLLV